ncbi:hypothetical protein HYH03_013466 [Edaphochlamys debaryana]|uniref:Glycoprotein endo-alpha-1,2-mannosidase-like protein n=1 Tax=Edaphochlamys debaryana TaxID=47281 RepID=A0A836BUG4_9CHLO|nr:hypothetical protein HYH03_013466 [Edaphochlamys debaryana]|eukprot:KAG2487884.1 hypothetical protein HYH03_013466 [Edaphochlamys debaryana]
MTGVTGALAILLLASMSLAAAGIPPLYRVHAFYYLWYGEPSTGRWAHWDHEVLSHWDPNTAKNYPQGVRFEPPDCLHCPYYPLRGPYSSASPELVRQHLEEMTEHGIGVLVASWWGPPWRAGSHDTQLVNTDERVAQVVREIEAMDSPVRVAIHMEPYEGRTKETVREDLAYLVEKYKDSKAILRINERPCYYVYDSYRLPASDWAELLRPEGSISVRGTELDGYFLGLWLDRDDGEKNIKAGGFEGAYTYFASEATSYASNPTNWPAMQKWSVDNGLMFVPSIGPGYTDSKIRPWNTGATRDRESGGRYERAWDAAVAVAAQMVSITSYNEWGEGTQIEPAVPRQARHECSYLSYEPHGPFRYMQLTKQYAAKLAKRWEILDPPAKADAKGEPDAAEAGGCSGDGGGSDSGGAGSAGGGEGGGGTGGSCRSQA